MPAKIMTIVGTRPEAIKMIPVIRALRAEPFLRVISVSTGQHNEMLAQVFGAFNEKADEDLGIMVPNQGLAALTSAVITRMMDVFAAVSPDAVLVHGDTTTAMAAAIAAFYARIPIGHVEAGLRSHNLNHPWPEEFNRVAIDCIAASLFAPTEVAAGNLAREYNRHGSVYVTGNTGIDALMIACGILVADRPRAAALLELVGLPHTKRRRLILVAGHRRENFGEGLQRICDGLAALSRRDDVVILYPVHMNPKVSEVVHARLKGNANIILTEPVDYLTMVQLMRAAQLIITDSGGIQEEAPALGNPVLVMRETTERPEALASGIVKLVGTDPARMYQEASSLLDDADEYARRARGDGMAAHRIAAALVDCFARRE